MKTLLLTIIIALTFFSFQSKQRPVLIKAGQEVDKLKLNKSIAQAAFLKYGNNTDFSEGIGCGFEHDYHTNRFSFSLQGVTVISRTIDNEVKKNALITNIGVYFPCDAETEDGISLTRDNVDQIINVYGNPEAIDTSRTFMDINYKSKGISFSFDIRKTNILKIEIYEVGLTPDFGY